MNITLILIQYLALIFSLVVHEFSHGFAAHLLGDDTAVRAGRLTLNPVAHADLMGTVVLPLTCIALGAPVFGWAKPVPYNPYNLSNQKWGPTVVALAGPFSNFTLAAIFLTVLKVMNTMHGLDGTNLLVVFLLQMAIINVVLGVFNLIPIPPLDGSKLLRAIFSGPRHEQMHRMLETQGQRWFFIILIGSAVLGISLFGGLFTAALRFAFGLFGFGGLF